MQVGQWFEVDSENRGLVLSAVHYHRNKGTLPGEFAVKTRKTAGGVVVVQRIS